MIPACIEPAAKSELAARAAANWKAESDVNLCRKRLGYLQVCFSSLSPYKGITQVDRRESSRGARNVPLHQHMEDCFG